MAQPFDEEAMKDRNRSETFHKKIHTYDADKKVIDMDIWHYTNHNINEFLTEQQHALLRKE